MSHVSRYSLVLACTLMPLGLAAQAQNAFYTTGTYTIDAAHSVANTAYVGLDSSFSRKDNMGNPYNPTVHLVKGGSVGSDLDPFNSSIVTVSGGSVGGGLLAKSSSMVTVSGGTFGQLAGFNFLDETTGSFTLVGNNLTATNVGTDPVLGGTIYDLSGTLQGGTNLRNYVLFVGEGGTFTLQSTAVPEPGSLALLAGMMVTGGVWVSRRRR